MQKYLNKAIIFDLIFCILLGVLISINKSSLKEHFNVPSNDTVNKFLDSIVKLGATLIGFLLTTITVIVTFRNAFLSQKNEDSKGSSKASEESSEQIPTKTIFDRIITKKDKFYKSEIHKKVMKVFLFAVYEIGLVVFLFLAIQSDIIDINPFWKVLIMILGFTSLSLSVIRSFYIYRLFIKVHL